MTRIALLLSCAALAAAQMPTRDQVLAFMKKSAEFYANKVSTGGGYHFTYAEDLSYGRSEHGEGPTQVEFQREGTPIVGMAYLEAFDATGDRFYLEAARAAASALVKGQLCTGGWDYLVEFDTAKRRDYAYRADNNCGAKRGVTNMDDNTTQGSLRLLMRVDKALNFSDKAIHEAARFALDSILKSQYPNGAWPQRYRELPDMSKHTVKKASYPDSWSRKWPGPGYEGHYTFNDNSILDTIDMYLEAARLYDEPKYKAAAERGGDFILLAQMPDPQPAWAQQYDMNMHPAWARIFEPPSVTGGESQSILQMLMVLYRETGNRKYLEPIPRALAYLRKSVLPGQGERPRRDREAGAWTGGGVRIPRFLELKTNKPLYITKGTRVTVKGQSTALLDGYEVSYDGSSIITHYGVVTSGDRLEAIGRDYEALAKADPGTIRRPAKLHGLSPWEERRASKPSADAVSKILSTADPRGVWLDDGYIGKSNRIVSVFAAKDMTLTIGGKAYPVKENQTIDLFEGTERPKEKVFRSATFARNLVSMSTYVSGPAAGR